MRAIICSCEQTTLKQWLKIIAHFFAHLRDNTWVLSASCNQVMAEAEVTSEVCLMLIGNLTSSVRAGRAFRHSSLQLPTWTLHTGCGPPWEGVWTGDLWFSAAISEDEGSHGLPANRTPSSWGNTIFIEGRWSHFCSKSTHPDICIVSTDLTALVCWH